jgi:hypothetical protein
VKVFSKALGLAGAVCGLACTVLGPKLPQQPSGRIGSDAAIQFFVYTGEHVEGLPGIEVRLVASEGVRVLGATDRNGEFKVPKTKLHAAWAVLFCWAERFECSAVRLDHPDILGFDELNVELPIPKIIDRFTVHRQ